MTVLPGAEVTLVPLDVSHAEAMLGWTSQADLADNLGLRTPPSLEKTLEYIARARSDPSYAAFAILLDARHVGNVILDQIDRRVDKARLHIYVGDNAARGHGVGKRALSLALEHAFAQLALFKVWLTVHAENEQAIRAYRAVGFTLEGTHRGEFLLRGQRKDDLYMGILRTDPRPAITESAKP
jgi:diamine N-acetyltransferase